GLCDDSRVSVNLVRAKRNEVVPLRLSGGGNRTNRCPGIVHPEAHFEDFRVVHLIALLVLRIWSLGPFCADRMVCNTRIYTSLCGLTQIMRQKRVKKCASGAEIVSPDPVWCPVRFMSRHEYSGSMCTQVSKSQRSVSCVTYSSFLRMNCSPMRSLP